MQIVQISTRLDRLSALLDGVAPVFSVFFPSEHCRPGHGLVPEAERSLAMVIDATKPKLGVEPSAAPDLAPALWIGHLAHWVGCEAEERSEAAESICIRAQLTGPLGPLLMEEFAEPIELTTDTDETALSAPIALIRQEINRPRCGQPALLKSAGDILFIGILRNIVANPKPERPGLLRALSDARIAKALIAMHQVPHLNWNLSSLALEAGMSRTSFATTFKKAMNKTPRKYLVALRLALARRALDNGKTVKEAARLSGYRRPSSIARALKNESGSDA